MPLSPCAAPQPLHLKSTLLHLLRPYPWPVPRPPPLCTATLRGGPPSTPSPPAVSPLTRHIHKAHVGEDRTSCMAAARCSWLNSAWRTRSASCSRRSAASSVAFSASACVSSLPARECSACSRWNARVCGTHCESSANFPSASRTALHNTPASGYTHTHDTHAALTEGRPPRDTLLSNTAAARLMEGSPSLHQSRARA